MPSSCAATVDVDSMQAPRLTESGVNVNEIVAEAQHGALHSGSAAPGRSAAVTNLAPVQFVASPAHGSSAPDEPLRAQPHPPVPQQAQQHAHTTNDSAKPAWQGYSSVFTAAKAGMQNVDKEKVKKVVYEMSKDSAHFRNEQRKQAQVDAKIAHLKAKAAALSSSELAGYQKACDAKITQLEATRDLTKTWLHVDMDAFYASVEELEQPTLKSKPMAVGGMGMICTANYEARKYGVRSAMPGFIARKLCPQLVFVKPDFVKYTAASEQTRAVFRLYDPAFEAGSLDEAYLDVTEYCKQHSVTGEQVAAELRGKVTAATQLTCSVGVATNSMLAKVASDMNKPNGQFVVAASREAVMAFMNDLPIRKIPGIGKVSEQTLNALGINTCSQILEQRALIAALLSSISCSFLLSVGLGLGSTEHSSRGAGENSTEPRRKGISCERTFSAMSSPTAMEQMADTLVQHLANDMAAEAIEAKTLTLKLKTTAFQVRTRAVTLPQYVSTAEQMLPPILKLLKAELPVEIRLMGVRGSNLRKVQKLGDIASASSGGKLNALQRLILQGRQQQQLLPGQQQDQQCDADCKQMSSEHGQQEEHDQQQQGQEGLRLDIDILDEGQYGSEWTAGGEGYDSDNDVQIVSQDPSDPTEAAAQHKQPERDAYGPAERRQPEAQHIAQQPRCAEQVQGWQQWQQLRAPGDQVIEGIQELHQQVLQHHAVQQGQQSDQPPGRKRARLMESNGLKQQEQLSAAESAHCQSMQQEQQRQHAHEGDPADGPVLAGQWYKASQLPMDWQQQQEQQEVGKEDGAGHAQQETRRDANGWQLEEQQTNRQLQQQQTQQQYYHGALPHGPIQQQRFQAAPQWEGGTTDDLQLGGQQKLQDNLPSKPQPRSRAKCVWTCLACTFSNNPAIMLRCEVCDTPKGENSAPPAGWLCTRDGGSASSGTAGRRADSKISNSKPGRQQSKKGCSSARQLSLDSVLRSTSKHG